MNLKATIRTGLWLLAFTIASAAGAQTAAEKSQMDLDFWRSVEKIDTADAYKAYLETYPSGRFALLARAALKKFQNGQSAGAAAPPAASAAAPAPSATAGTSGASGSLSAYSAETNSGATDLMVGNRLIGPGVVTLGRLGAKRQIAIPNGEWVVLAASDFKSLHATPVALSTIALGRFEAQYLRSLILVTINRSPTNSPPGSKAWPDAASCETQVENRLVHLKDGEITGRTCLLVRQLEPLDFRNVLTPVIAKAMSQDLDAGIKGLNARTGQFNLQTVQYVTDFRNNYFRFERFDCTQTGSDPSKCLELAAPRRGEPLAPGLESRMAWAKAYFPLALAGFKRDIDTEDLQVGVAAKTRPFAIPD